MKSRFSIKTLFFTLMALFAVLISKAQLASQKPLPKKSHWMSKVEQNRNTAKKQLNGHRTATILPASPRNPQNAQPTNVQPDRRTPVNTNGARAGQQQATGQKTQLPVRPKVKDTGGQ